MARPRRTSTSTSRRSWPPPVRACAWPRDGEDGAARRALEGAESRYGGEFLEEDPYEDWAVGLREEAQAAYISVTRLLADGPPRPATPTARRATTSGSSSATHTTRRPTWGSSGALLAAGRHGEARRRYGIYATGWRRWASRRRRSRRSAAGSGVGRRSPA